MEDMAEGERRDTMKQFRDQRSFAFFPEQQQRQKMSSLCRVQDSNLGHLASSRVSQPAMNSCLFDFQLLRNLLRPRPSARGSDVNGVSA